MSTQLETIPWKQLSDFAFRPLPWPDHIDEVKRRLATVDALRAEVSQSDQNTITLAGTVDLLRADLEKAQDEISHLNNRLEETKSEIARLAAVVDDTRRKALEEMASKFNSWGNHAARNCCLLQIDHPT